MEADPLQEDLLCWELKWPGCPSPGSTGGDSGTKSIGCGSGAADPARSCQHGQPEPALQPRERRSQLLLQTAIPAAPIIAEV